MEDKLKRLYITTYGSEPVSMERLSAAGSNRTYYRMVGLNGKSVIGCVGTSVDENASFIYISRHFAEKSLPVPQVISVSEDMSCYIQEDLGTDSLYELVSRGRCNGGVYDDDEIALLKRTLTLLPDLQFRGAEDFDFGRCYQCKEMDLDSIMFDLNYFKYCYLKLSGIEFDEFALERDFKLIASQILAHESDTFLYRDFQARNVMISGGEPFFIDFQGGRKGPIYYDVASFLWQASSNYNDELRSLLIDEYLLSLQRYKKIGHSDFLKNLSLFVLFRTLQVLGAYGFRGLWEKKQYFINSIPAALNNLERIVKDGACDDYPELHRIACALCEQNKCLNKKGEDSDNQLVVRVFSFSYKKGIPIDKTGNGGGYVFDCRAPNNPGRYEPYKHLTGLDQPVIDFIEHDGELPKMLNSMYSLVDFHVRRYVDRGFTSLMISCGCTGGQHRSVYSAQHIAEYIHDKFGVEVHLCHREQGINTIFPRRQE